MMVIVDYGMGNLRSVLNKLERMDIEVSISSNIKDIEAAEKLILSGVGFFASGMANLREMGLLPVLVQKVCNEKVPVLGICLGMQLLSRRSEEGDAEGLGWIESETKRFSFGQSTAGLKIPHMGWNGISIKKRSPLLEGIPNDAKFYFVHSYHLDAEKSNDIAVAVTNYGYDFPSIVQKDNIFATQFHPEKSHAAGMKILENFSKVI